MNDADSRYDELRLRYADSLERKHDEIARAWQAFAQGPHSADARRDLHAQVHRLSGSAPSYGYIELGVRAAAVDELLTRAAATSDSAHTFDAPMQALLGALLEAASPAHDPPRIP